MGESLISAAPSPAVTDTGTGRHLSGRWRNGETELFADIFFLFFLKIDKYITIYKFRHSGTSFTDFEE